MCDLNLKFCSLHFRLILLPIRIGIFALLFSTTGLAIGTLDPGFGNGGKVNFGFSASSDNLAQAAALQADGKIVIVGTTAPNGNIGFRDFAVARLNSNGIWTVLLATAD